MNEAESLQNRMSELAAERSEITTVDKKQFEPGDIEILNMSLTRVEAEMAHIRAIMSKYDSSSGEQKN